MIRLASLVWRMISQQLPLISRMLIIIPLKSWQSDRLEWPSRGKMSPNRALINVNWAVWHARVCWMPCQLLVGPTIEAVQRTKWDKLDGEKVYGKLRKRHWYVDGKYKYFVMEGFRWIKLNINEDLSG